VTDIFTFHDIEHLHRVTDTLQTPVFRDFHIYRNEDADKTCRQSMFAHRCTFFQVSIDKQSGYSLYHNSKKIDTTANTVYFVGEGKLTSWQTDPDKRTWKGYNVIFKPDFLSIGNNNFNFRKEFPFLRINNDVSLSIPADDQTLFELCERMLYEQNNQPADPNILRHYLYTFLYILRRLYLLQHSVTRPQQVSREAEIAVRFEEMLYENIPDSRSIHAFASKLFVTPKYLTEATKAIYGKTAKEMIMHKMLEEARSLLVQTNLSLTEIASRLNFNDTSNFIKFFKKLSGEGPSDFRNRSAFNHKS
jgi:AraC family transcriptional regulator, transcriptional activator of pobA